MAHTELCSLQGRRLGKVDVEIMKQDLGTIYNCVSIQESINNSIRVHARKALLEWAADLLRARTLVLLFCQGYSPLYSPASIPHPPKLIPVESSQWKIGCIGADL